MQLQNLIEGEQKPMSTKAIIPCKVYGSKGLPGKFTMHLCGRELWEWVTIAAIDCKQIDEVIMTGNAKEKKHFYSKVKLMYPSVKWITRPASLQKNGVELLDVMQHALKKIGKKGDVFVQLQATKPLTTARLLDEILSSFFAKGLVYGKKFRDSLFTIQKINTAINWEYKASRQEGQENFKSCAVAKAWDYDTLKNAKKGTWGFGKNHYDYVIDQTHIEVDDIIDFRMAEALMRAGM